MRFRTQSQTSPFWWGSWCPPFANTSCWQPWPWPWEGLGVVILYLKRLYRRYEHIPGPSPRQVRCIICYVCAHVDCDLNTSVSEGYELSNNATAEYIYAVFLWLWYLQTSQTLQITVESMWFYILKGINFIHAINYKATIIFHLMFMLELFSPLYLIDIKGWTFKGSETSCKIHNKYFSCCITWSVHGAFQYQTFEDACGVTNSHGWCG